MSSNGEWRFTGKATFEDLWNFDPKWFAQGSKRTVVGEIKTIVGASAIPGKPYLVKSEEVDVSQTSNGWKVNFKFKGALEATGDRSLPVGAASGVLSDVAMPMGPDAAGAADAAPPNAAEDTQREPGKP